MIVKAFTVTESHDAAADFTYYVVNLHDYEPAPNAKIMMKLFHDRGEAEKFAEECRQAPQNQ